MATPAAADDGCERLLRHFPAPDVAYRPGVDVRGRPVAPADLAPPASAAGETILVDLTLPAAFGRRDPARGERAEVLVGLIEIDPASGAMWLDGRPLGDADGDRLLAYCRGAVGLPPLPAHKPMP